MATGVPFWRHFRSTWRVQYCPIGIANGISVEKRNRVVAEKMEMLQFWKKNLQILNFEY